MKSPLTNGWTRIESGLIFLPVSSIGWMKPVKVLFFTIGWKWMVTRLGSHDPVVSGYGVCKADAKRQGIAWVRSLRKP